MDPNTGPELDPTSFLPFFILAFVIVLLVWLRERAARRTPAAPPPMPESSETNEPLREQATSALVGLDHVVQSFAEEVHAARADLGSATVHPFQVTVTVVRAKVEDAFHVLDELEQDRADGTVFAGVERRRLSEILDLSRTSTEELASQEARLVRQRGLHERVADVLDPLAVRVDGVAARLPEARQVLEDLAASHSETARHSLTLGYEQGARLVTAAGELIADAREHVSTGDRTAAASAVRATERAIGQADDLISGVVTAHAVLREAAEDLEDALASIRKDITDAATLDSPDDLTTRAVEQAKTAVAEGTAARDGGDVIAALTTLERAETHLDNALEPHLEAARHAAIEERIDQSRVRRRELLIQRRIHHARRRIDEMTVLVSSHRGWLGDAPRRDLLRARRLVLRAEEESGPLQAIELLDQAEDLADLVHRESIVAHNLDREPVSTSTQAVALLGLAVGGIAIGGIAAAGGLLGQAGATAAAESASRLDGIGGGGRF